MIYLFSIGFEENIHIGCLFIFHIFRTGCNALHHAINGGHLRIVLYILDRTGRELVNDKDDSGWTPLMRAGKSYVRGKKRKCIYVNAFMLNSVL